MTEIHAYRVGDIPLIRIKGPITVNTGTELAAEVMTAICDIIDEQGRKPLSLCKPQLPPCAAT